MTRIEMSSTEIQRDWSRVQKHLDNGHEVAVVRYSRRIALITAYPQDEPARTTLAGLANDLGTTVYVLMEFAPDDITADMDGGTEIPADVEAMIREAWAGADDAIDTATEDMNTVLDQIGPPPAGRQGGVYRVDRDDEGNITGAEKLY